MPTRPADGDPGRLLAAGVPDRIAQRRGEPGSFRLSGGGGARLPRTDPLANAPLLAVAALELKAAARIRLAAPLDPDDAAGSPRITEQVETSFDPVSGAVLARRRRRLRRAGAVRPHRAGRPRGGRGSAGPRRGGRRRCGRCPGPSRRGSSRPASR